MRIVVATTVAPFARGGDRVHAEGLVAALRERDLETEYVAIPFWSEPSVMVEQMAALRLTDLSVADRLICLRTPSYLLPHPDKVVWFMHHHRGSYDLWDTPYAEVPDNPRQRAFRQAIMHADTVGLGEARRIYANSRTLADRLARFNQIAAPVLRVPLSRPERFHPGPYGDYVLCPGRITVLKRQHLFVEAMRHVRSDVRLVVAGRPDQQHDARRLEKAARRAGARVTCITRWIPHAELVELYAGALAVGHAPYDEDAHSYVNLEAFAAAKGVISCTDSGGALELLRDGENSLVVGATPEELAAAIDRVADRRLAARLGAEARASLDMVDTSWDRVIAELIR